MNWKRRLLKSFRLYAVTDINLLSGNALNKIDAMLQGGVDIVQLRAKTLPDRDLLKLGRSIRLMTQRNKKLFIVNDRVDLALAIKADGVHLGQDDLSISFARKLSPSRDFIIGKSTHSIRQAIDAEREGADYIGFGPIFKTPTKPTYVPVGLVHVSSLIRLIDIPFVCIGGINEMNIDKVINAGGTRVAVVRALFNSRYPKQTAIRLKAKLS